MCDYFSAVRLFATLPSEEKRLAIDAAPWLLNAFGLCELDTSILEVLGQPRRRDVRLLARDNWTKLGWWDWLFGIQKARVRPVIIRLTLGEWNRFVNGVSPQYQMQVSRPTILCSCEQIANIFSGRGRDRRESALRLAASRAFWSCGVWESQITARQFLERSGDMLERFVGGCCVLAKDALPR